MYPDCKKELENTDQWIVYWDGQLPEDTQNSNLKLKSLAIEARTWAWQQYKKGKILIAYRNNELSNWRPQYVCKKREPRQNTLPPRQNRFAPPIN
tara:strand:- start:1041 stop:1325 length:285 start_codon:yes stop_codon:yes gene_type:complete